MPTVIAGGILMSTCLAAKGLAISGGPSPRSRLRSWTPGLTHKGLEVIESSCACLGVRYTIEGTGCAGQNNLYTHPFA
jgi:hypothetical protein